MAASFRAVLTDARASAVPQVRERPSAAAIWALGRIEARRMVLHPSFYIGIAFGVLMLRGAFGADGTGFDLAASVAWLTGGALLGLLVGTVLTANVAAIRAHRDHVQELFGALPAPPETRTAGALAGLVLGPVAVSVVLAAMAPWTFGINEDIAPNIDLFLVIRSR